MWEEPSLARFLRRLSSFSRLICFDKRGCGLSDPVLFHEGLSAESWIDDTRTVLRAVGSERAALFGHAEGARMGMLYARRFRRTPPPWYCSIAMHGGCVTQTTPGECLKRFYPASSRCSMPAGPTADP